ATLSASQLPVGSNVVAATFLGTSNWLGTSNSLVQVVTSSVPTLGAISIHDNGNDTVTITFRGLPGTNYVAQATEDPTSTNSWLNIATNTPAGDGQWTVTDSTAGHAKRFYRMAVAPAASEPLTIVGIKANGNGTITVTFHGTPGNQYVVQASTNIF